VSDNGFTRDVKRSATRRKKFVNGAWPELVAALESALHWAKKRDSGWTSVELEHARKLTDVIKVTE